MLKVDSNRQLPTTILYPCTSPYKFYLTKPSSDIQWMSVRYFPAFALAILDNCFELLRISVWPVTLCRATLVAL